MTAAPLAHLAQDPARSRGRRYGGPDLSERRGPRDAFGRDRDRIIHSVAFRRLGGKTQVFVAPDDDHYRVRLTHSLEVAQIARTIARALGLNSDLTEAIALAHDLGHPPFGHAGEDALKAALSGHGGWNHNGHTIRVVTQIERTYPRFPGLDLTWETLEGLAKHNGPVRHPGWALAQADEDWPLALATRPSLEAQVAAIADDIAYDNHDIDDGLRSGVLPFAPLLDIPFLGESWARVCGRFPDAPIDLRQRELVREGIGAMVSDVIRETVARVEEAGITTADAVRSAGRPMVGFSTPLAEAERSIKRTMYANLYHSPSQREVAAEARRVVAGLFAAYRADPTLLPPAWADLLPQDDTLAARHISDFIAGMTDRYAIARHRELVGPVMLPERF